MNSTDTWVGSLAIPCIMLMIQAIGMHVPAQAQAVVSDGTMNTVVTRSGNNFIINNGRISGANLFHSFSEFSIPTNGSAFFNNAINVDYIFARVTGAGASNLDGVIRANGSANLFLMNPSGIVFGPNAALNLGGSFIGTTAQSVRFADGVEWSTVNLVNQPLLTMTVPIGLQMGRNAAPIAVQNAGHKIQFTSLLSPLSSEPSIGLRIQPTQTFALIGNGLNFQGGILKSLGGRIDLASVGEQTFVPLAFTPQGIELRQVADDQLRNIQIFSKSLIEAGGLRGGSIQLQGRKISVNDASIVSVQNFGALPSGDVRIRASEALHMVGSDNRSVSTAISTTAMSTGTGGNIVIETPGLILEHGASIMTRTFGSGSGGDINLTIADAVKLVGFSRFNPNQVSLIGTAGFASGKVGNINLVTPELSVLAGAGISSANFSTQSGGNIQVKADRIALIGLSPLMTNSTISSNTYGKGDSGELVLQARSLKVLDGAALGSATYGQGSSGRIMINATESIEVSGKLVNNSLAGGIGSAALTPVPAIQQLFNLSSMPSGNAGELFITTPRLSLTDDARVSVQNQGQGNAGALSIRAETIDLNRRSTISAATFLGVGGDLTLNTKTLQLRQESAITSEAGLLGRGGNITIDADIIVGLENSDIIANAVRGRGGNIDITTQGIVGLALRNTQFPRQNLTNDITSSSEFNVNGNIVLNNLGLDPDSGLVTLPGTFTDSNQKIDKSCAAARESQFVITGRGGMPSNPATKLQGYDRPWQDLRSVSVNPAIVGTNAEVTSPPSMLLEVDSWQRNAQTGEVELVAQASMVRSQGITCGAGL